MTISQNLLCISYACAYCIWDLTIVYTQQMLRLCNVNAHAVYVFKANHVFDYLDVSRYYNGLVLLLEDDHYVIKDFIPVLHQMYRLRQR